MPETHREMKPSRPTSPEAKRIAVIFHRKLTTRWQPKEIQAFKLLLPIEELDLALMERYYRMNWPPRHGKNALRTDLYTVLNNWTGELDRANTWNETHPEKPKPRVIIPLPPTPSEPLILSAEDQQRSDRFMAELRARKPRSAFDQVRKIMES